MKLWLIAAISFVVLPYLSPQSNSTKEVSLQLVNPRITENGEEVYGGGGDCACGGAPVLAFHLPLRGWVVMSTEPQAGYDFQKIGKVRGNQISFRLDNQAYEIVADKDIDPQKYQQELWVVRIPPPPDKLDTDRKLISCASSIEYWLKTCLSWSEKQ